MFKPVHVIVCYCCCGFVLSCPSPMRHIDIKLTRPKKDLIKARAATAWIPILKSTWLGYQRSICMDQTQASIRGRTMEKINPGWHVDVLTNATFWVHFCCFMFSIQDAFGGTVRASLRWTWKPIDETSSVQGFVSWFPRFHPWWFVFRNGSLFFSSRSSDGSDKTHPTMQNKLHNLIFANAR